MPNIINWKTCRAKRPRDTSRRTCWDDTNIYLAIQCAVLWLPWGNGDELAVPLRAGHGVRIPAGRPRAVELFGQVDDF
jgi:hypothetical protein